MSCSRGQGLKELYGIVVSDLVSFFAGKDLFFSTLFADILPLSQYITYMKYPSPPLPPEVNIHSKRKIIIHNKIKQAHHEGADPVLPAGSTTISKNNRTRA